MAFGVYTWQNGIVSPNTGAHDSVSDGTVQTNRQAVFVSSTHANASDSNAGTSPEAPLATIVQALTNAAGNDYLIVVAADHVETISATISQANTWIVGEGTGDGRPRLTASTSVDNPIFTVTGDAVVIRNLVFIDASYVPVETRLARTDPLVEWDGDYGVITDCEFDLAPAYIGADIALRVGNGASATYLEVDRCEFNCLDPDNDDNPTYALYASGSNANGLRVTNCTFDGGTYGYDGAALCIGLAAAVVNFYVYGNTFQYYADCSITHNSCRGILGGNTFASGSSFVVDMTAQAAMKHWPNGLIRSSEDGHALLRASDFYTFGRVFWVNSTSAYASDASGYGVKRNRPFATLSYALTQIGTGQCDLIILDENHEEELAATETISATFVKIYGVGAGTSRPSITIAGVAPVTGDIFSVSGAGWEIHGVQFPVSTLAPSVSRIEVTAAGAVIEGCAFACGAEDATSVTFSANANGWRFENNAFTISASGPNIGLYVNNQASSYCLAYNNTSTGDAAYTWVNGWMQSSAISGAGMLVLQNTMVTQSFLDIVQTSSTTVHLAGNVVDDTSEVRWS